MKFILLFFYLYDFVWEFVKLPNYLIMSKFFNIIKDFPQKDINFFDFQKTFDDPALFNELIDLFIQKIKENNYIDKLDYLACLDARGFIYGGIIANKINKPFFLIRKYGKLAPPVIVSDPYKKEYETTDKIPERLCMSPIKNKNILLIDDILATGGTLNTAYDLIHKSESTVLGAIVIKEIDEINTNMKMNVHTLI